MDITLRLTFVAASAALLVIPGPTVLLVMSHALSQAHRVALASAAGVAPAMFASLAGLGALVPASATLFTVLKWVGAAYLVWMGWTLFRSAGSASPVGPATGGEVSAREVFGHAALVTALNPKGIVFFIAFVPQFVRPGAPLLPQFAILTATFVGLAMLNVLGYALLADRLRQRLRQPGVLRRMAQGGGIALMGIGALMALTRRAAGAVAI